MGGLHGGTPSVHRAVSALGVQFGVQNPLQPEAYGTSWNRAERDPQVGESGAFSFNDPAGMCPRCSGIGRVVTPDTGEFLDLDRSLEDGAILLPGFGNGQYWYRQDEEGTIPEEERIRPIGLHECRHTAVSQMRDAGISIDKVSKFMGHASITITIDRYGHLLPGGEAEAAALLDAYHERKRRPS